MMSIALHEFSPSDVRRFARRIALSLCWLSVNSVWATATCIGQTAPASDERTSETTSQSATEIPAWTKRGTYSENDITYLVAETDRPFIKPVQADAALDDAIRNAVRKYFEQQIGHELPNLQISDSDIKSRLLVPGTRVVKQFDEQYSPELAQRYGGVDHDTYYRGFAQVRLDAAFRDSVNQRLHRDLIQYRLGLAALLGTGVLALLGILFGYLRIDHATRGFYNRRLQTVCVLLAGAIVVLIFIGLGWLSYVR